MIWDRAIDLWSCYYVDPCAGLDSLEGEIGGVNNVLSLFGIGNVPCSGRSEQFSYAFLAFFGVFNYLF